MRKIKKEREKEGQKEMDNIYLLIYVYSLQTDSFHHYILHTEQRERER